MVLEQKKIRIPEKKTRAINNIHSPFSTDMSCAPSLREGPPLRAQTAETYRQALGWPASAARPGTEAKGRRKGELSSLLGTTTVLCSGLLPGVAHLRRAPEFSLNSGGPSSILGLHDGIGYQPVAMPFMKPRHKPTTEDMIHVMHRPCLKCTCGRKERIKWIKWQNSSHPMTTVFSSVYVSCH